MIGTGLGEELSTRFGVSGFGDYREPKTLKPKQRL